MLSVGSIVIGVRVRERLNVTNLGRPSGPTLLFAHGYGCDQNMWRHIVPEFVDDYRVVLFDIMGYGGSDTSYYDASEYSTLDRYAADVLAIVDELDLQGVVLIGHSVSAMIGALATIARPDRFAGLVMVSPSPRYIDDDTYVGGFSESDIDDLLESLESNYLGWSKAITPVIMGNPDRPELADELDASFCRADPTIARNFARITFLSDSRTDLERVPVATLVVQCEDDAIAPKPVGEFVHNSIPNSEFVVLDVAGHCPNLSAPEPTGQAIKSFVAKLRLPV